MAAIGFIETKGLVAAIEAADAMLKAADVRLLERTQVGSGLVTITVAGEVSAVKASVDAGVCAIKRIEGACLVSQHVIPRPDAEVSAIIATEPGQAEAAPAEEAPVVEEPAMAEPEVVEPETVAEPEAPVVEEAPVEDVAADEEPAEEAPVEAEPVKAAPAERHNISQLKKMKVGRLRQIARSLSGLPMTRDEIKSAKKKDLIEVIVNAYRQIEE
ncbi:BMC domain-containing protein [Desulfovibrio sp. IOR2]|uniref:BMC domain-containing protein n=1 Tax=Salidesulfovibrio onnuriiensis TaxID=2583823 RepID=UPI0011C7528D